MMFIQKDSRCFFPTATISLLIAILVIGGWIGYSYIEFRREKINAFTQKAQWVEKELQAVFSPVVYGMEQISRRIAYGGESNNTLTMIAKLLQQEIHVNKQLPDYIYSSHLNWTTPLGEILVDAEKGVRDSSHFSITLYPHNEKAREHPGAVYFSSPVQISPEQTMGLPLGIGVSGQPHKVNGILSAVIDIGAVNATISEKLKDKDVSFLLLDEESKVVLYSSDNKLSAISPTVLPITTSRKDGNIFSKARLTEIDSITIGDISYSHLYQLSDYPFRIITGYSSSALVTAWKNAFLFNTGMFLIWIVVSVLIVLGLRRMMTEPIDQVCRNLHELLEKKAEGGSKIHYFVSKTETSNPLLDKISGKAQAMEHEELLAEAIRIVDEVDRARDWLTQEVLRSLHTPIQALMQGVRMLKEESLGPLDKASYGKYLDSMYEATQMLSSYSSDLLSPMEVDVREVLEKCMVMQRKDALKSRIRMELLIKKPIPLIWADRVRLRQIVASTIYQSLAYLAPYRTVTIAVDVERNKEGHPSLLMITVADNGLGFNVEAREGAKNPYIHSKKPFDLIRLDLSMIQYLVRLHQGSFEMITRCGAGTSFIIRLPYLSREALLLPVDSGDVEGKEPSKIRTLDLIGTVNNNVVPFPGRGQ